MNVKIKIVLVDINEDVVKGFQKYFSNLENFDIKLTSIFDDDIKPDIVVSPANSFGFLNGGIDWLYTEVMGPQVQVTLQNIIKTDCDGELLVGQSLIIKTDFEKVPYLIASPTMKIPKPIYNTDNVYLAAKATFNLIYSDDLMQSISENLGKEEITIAIPGFGTATGKMDPYNAAYQMKRGYIDARTKWFPGSLLDAAQQSKELRNSL